MTTYLHPWHVAFVWAIAGLTLGNPIRFGFRSVPRLGQDPANGNLLDDVRFGIGVGVPEPSTAVIGGMSLLGLLLRRGERREE